VFVSPHSLPGLMRISVVLNMKLESRLRAINTQPLLLSVMKQSISLSLLTHPSLVSAYFLVSDIGFEGVMNCWLPRASLCTALPITPLNNGPRGGAYAPQLESDTHIPERMT